MIDYKIELPSYLGCNAGFNFRKCLITFFEPQLKHKDEQ